MAHDNLHFSELYDAADKACRHLLHLTNGLSQRDPAMAKIHQHHADRLNVVLQKIDGVNRDAQT